MFMSEDCPGSTYYMLRKYLLRTLYKKKMKKKYNFIIVKKDGSDVLMSINSDAN